MGTRAGHADGRDLGRHPTPAWRTGDACPAPRPAAGSPHRGPSDEPRGAWMTTVVVHPEWCHIKECRVRPDGSGEHWSRPVKLETAGRVLLRIRGLHDGRPVGADTGVPPRTPQDPD